MTDYLKNTAALLERARDCFKLVDETERAQRQREREDLRFQVPEMQWTDKAREERMGSFANGVSSPPRPILSISQLDQPVQLVMNQAQSAELGINVHPVNEKADDDTAEVQQDLIRRIERDSVAQDARLWALDRSVKAGRGVYAVRTKYDEDADPETFDQEIVIDRILHQDMVYFDPAAQKPDYSDGEWAIEAAWVDLETFKRKWPKARPSDGQNKDEWVALSTEAPGWTKAKDGKQAVLVAKYWWKEHEYETIKKGKQTREKDIVTVYCVDLCGYDLLDEPQQWNGRWIPLIPVGGRELQPIQGERYWVGLYSNAKDGQRLKNFAASTLVERMTMEPKTPWIAYEGQLEGHENEWQASNVKNFPVLYVKPKMDATGQVLLPKPERAQLDQTGMSLALMALQQADQFIQTTTSIYDQSLGRSAKDESGRKVLALQGQSDASTSHFLANLARAMEYEAKVIIDLIPHIYDRPGRVMQVLGSEDNERMIMLNAPFIEDQQTGRPRPAKAGEQGAKHYDLTGGGAYKTSITIGKAFQTRLQAGNEMIGAILEKNPALMPIIGPLFFQYQDFPGASDIADMLKKMRDKQFPDLVDGDGSQAPTPEMLKSKMDSMGQQMQLTQAQLQAAMEQIKTEQAKQAAALEKARIDATTTLRKAEMDNAARIEVARIGAAKETLNQAAAAEEERLATGLQIAHEADQARQDRAHEVGMDAMQPPPPGPEEMGEGATPEGQEPTEPANG